jgi:asparagine synthase (glutamine-hydrolysing)
MRGILPSTILNRGKQGFSIPIKNWLRNEMRVYMQDVLGSSPLIKSAFNTDHIQQLVREHMDYRANHNHVLWALINLAVWHRQFVESPIPSADKVTSMPATQVNIMERVLE